MPSRHAGFTLLEILVVLVIIAFTAGIAILSIGGDNADERIKIEARRLTELLRLASDQAVMHGKEVGVEVSGDGYRFLVLQNRRWVPVSDEPSFRERTLDEPMELNVTLDADTKELFGKTLTRKRDEDRDGVESGKGKSGESDKDDTEADADKPDGPDNPKPQIFILSSGEVSPFAIGLGIEEAEQPRYWRIRSLEDGQIRLDGPFEGSLRHELKLDEPEQGDDGEEPMTDSEMLNEGEDPDAAR